MTNLIALISYSLAAFVFAVLFLLLLTGWRGRFQNRQLLVAVGASILWAAAGATQAAVDWAGFQLVWAAEVVRNLIWIFFLLHLLKPFAAGNPLYLQILGYVRLGCLVLALLMLVILVDIPFLRPMLQLGEMVGEFSLIGQLLFAVLGLALVEQLFRNTPAERRWGIKHLAFGLGAMFAYDFYLYSDALLVHRLDAAIWSARGFVVALAAPLIGLTAARNPDWNISVFVSRRMVLHSTTLFTAGVYMLLMALAGYYINSFGGEWGGVFQIAFLFGALVVLVALLFSGQLRARIRIFFDKHFFNYRYDYREEWLGVTHLLTEPGDGKPLTERVIWALAETVESAGGSLWMASEKGDYRMAAALMTDKDLEKSLPAASPLIDFLSDRRWVIDVDEYRNQPELYGDLTLPQWIEEDDNAWLIVPLIHDQRLLGFVLLLQPHTPQSINWENRDLLKTVGMQGASYLAFNQAAQALAEARQFEGFNRLSAFVIHDLKNLIAQLSLVAKNAARHKHNPAFIDDAVSTIDNAVAKMNRLMAQVQNADSTGQNRPLDLVGELRDVVAAKSAGSPSPVLTLEADDVMVLAESDRLTAVLGHVVQNAQDATPSDGKVEVILRASGDRAIVDVRDTGSGMDEEFIKTRLFRPFDSTKGLTGMGIGAYECREVISALGGQVSVESEPGHGTRFRIILPRLMDHPTTPVAPLTESAERV